jgi:preprotein translocase subunit SecA
MIAVRTGGGGRRAMASGTVGRLAGRLSGRREVRRCREVADLVAAAEPDFMALSDSALRALTGGFRARLAAGEDVFDLMIEAFAAVREASWRTLGLRHHDEQIMGGAAMAVGSVAEMQDSEGKTLTCVLPAYLAALEGAAVHVIATGDREAERAGRWMAPVYEALGMEVGVLRPELEADARREVYAADVVYGSSDEIGYDLLRDGMAWTPDEVVQRGLDVGIVDDARDPFIENSQVEMLISGPAPDEEIELRAAWAGVAGSLSSEAGDYAYDRRTRVVRLLEPGLDKLQDLLGVDELRPLEDAVQLDLIADVLAAREAGEPAPDPGRRVALEWISLGGFLREYGRLAGASADLAPVAEALERTYGMSVVPIPSRRPKREGDRRILNAVRFERRASMTLTVDLHRSERAAERAAILRGEAPALVERLFDEFLEQVLRETPRTLTRDDLADVLDLIGDTYPVSVTAEELARAPRRGAVVARLRADIAEAHGRRERELGSEVMRELERRVLLSVMDRRWREHLARTRALPGCLTLLGAVDGEEQLIEAYLDAAAESHLLMKDMVAQDTVGYLFNLDVDVDEDAEDDAPGTDESA